MARYFTKKITTRELADSVLYAYRNENQFESYEPNKGLELIVGTETYLEEYNKGKIYQFTGLTSQILKDLKKIEFSDENSTANPREAYGTWRNGEAKDYVGFHTLENGLSFFGVTAGGDWEVPIFYMIYSDGKKLRAYIPTEGNTWNRVNKEAFGNDEEKDELDLQRKGLQNMDEVYHDCEKLKADILERIVYTGA
ncbi:MAG: hypothetical protein WCI72_01325 [archaeon]